MQPCGSVGPELGAQRLREAQGVRRAASFPQSHSQSRTAGPAQLTGRRRSPRGLRDASWRVTCQHNPGSRAKAFPTPGLRPCGGGTVRPETVPASGRLPSRPPSLSACGRRRGRLEVWAEVNVVCKAAARPPSRARVSAAATLAGAQTAGCRGPPSLWTPRVDGRAQSTAPMCGGLCRSRQRQRGCSVLVQRC